MNPQLALSTYQRELEIEVYQFANYKCSLLPDLRRQARELLGLVQRGSISLEAAETTLGELQIRYMEAMQ